MTGRFLSSCHSARQNAAARAMGGDLSKHCWARSWRQDGRQSRLRASIARASGKEVSVSHLCGGMELQNVNYRRRLEG